MRNNTCNTAMTIWKKECSIKKLNALTRQSIEEHLGIKMVEIGDDFLKATMPVDHRTRQPFGILHGGASVVMAETLGSLASYFVLESEERYPVGIEINANHIRAVSEGEVTGIVRPIHLGISTHIWEIRILDPDDRLVCISRLTVAILDRKKG
jgi:1,4-dihydroxy-2-naphthoyl-CoA hydrolase